MDDLKKLFHIFKSPALTAVAGWAKSVRGRLAAVCLFSVAGILCSLAVTIVTKGLIDSAVSSQLDQLIRYGVWLAVLIVGERAIRFISSVIRISMSTRLQRNLQTELMQQLLSREYAGLKKYHSGELVSRVFSDVSVVKNGIVSLLPNLCSIAISFAGAVIILWSMNRRLVIVLLIVSLLGACFMLLFRNPMKERHKRMQQAESRLHASIQETLENIRTVKASLSEERIMHRVLDDQQMLEKEQRRQGLFSMCMNQSLGVMFDVSWLVCMLWGCYNIFDGSMTYGALAAMIQLIGRVQAPIASAADLAAQIYGVIASAERLLQVLDVPKEEQGQQISDFRSICLKDVGFVYDDGSEQVLKKINCEINKGDFVALTGISGGGKTSLFQLLLGMYRPTEGEVLFTTDSGAEVASRSTRSLFSYVPQGNTLISGSLRDNIRLFDSNATDDRIMQAAEAACIDELVRQIGLEATIGERGVGLSEGQAQRVAVARALLCDAPILLLDEATSALDDLTEAKLLKNISSMRKKTCIIVTHRPAALAICNKQFQIAEGRLTVTEVQ